MIERVKAQMVSLYLEDPAGNFSHPWYQINYWMNHHYLSVKFSEGIPSQIYIYCERQMVFYWNRQHSFRIDKTMYDKMERLILHERYLTTDLKKDFVIPKKCYRFVLKKNDFTAIQRNNMNENFSFKTINLNNDQSRHINLLTTLFSIDEEKLLAYLNTPLNKNGYAFVMVDVQTNRPLALGLGGIDSIVHEGVIEYLEVLPIGQMNIETIIKQALYELSTRLLQQGDFVSVTLDSKELMKLYTELGFRQGGVWVQLHRRQDSAKVIR